MSLCHGSGFTIGGYREEYREDVIQVTCTKCWLRVPAQPISSEWRTDLRTDGLPVEVNLRSYMTGISVLQLNHKVFHA